MEGLTMPALAGLPRTWSFGDLQQLPDTDSAGNDLDRRRFEILDGALVVSPPADSWHELMMMAVRDAVRDDLPDGYSAVASLGIDLRGSYLVPDLVIARTAVLVARVALLDPADVLLAVEVVSPGSCTMDRITKPARYAAAGIRGYWRVETDPEPTLAAYTLPPHAASYLEYGLWRPGQSAAIDEPFRVHLDMAALAR